MRYVVQLKRGVSSTDSVGWKERVKNTHGVRIIGSTETDTLVIEAGFDAYKLLLHQLGKICYIEKDLQTRFDV